jgi:hypothetical protein
MGANGGDEGCGDPVHLFSVPMKISVNVTQCKELPQFTFHKLSSLEYNEA